MPMADVGSVQRLLATRLERLAPQTSCLRWIDGELDGVVVDLFEDVAVLSLYRPAHPEEELALARLLAQARPLRAVYLKRRPKDAHRPANEAPEVVAPRAPLVGEAVSSLLTVEQGVRFEIRPDNGLSVGLYLDAREARARVRALARGRRVLNTFAYTCGFGVAAMLGGASRVANLDVSRRVLDWGEANYRLNGLEPQRFDFISGDVFEWLARLRKKGELFELIVLDPPGSFAGGGRRFSSQRDYHQLVQAAASVLAKEGLLVALCNVEAMSDLELLAQVKRGLTSGSAQVLERVEAPAADFVAGGFKCLVVEVR